MLDRPRHEEAIAAIREAGRARPVDHRRRRLGRAARGHRATRRVDLLWGSAARPRASSPPPRSSASAASCSGGCGRATTRAPRARSTPATTSTGSSRATTSSPATTCFFSATGVTDGDVLQGVRYRGARRDDRIAGHALALGHRAPGRRRSTTARSCARSAASATAEPRTAVAAVAPGLARQRDRRLGGVLGVDETGATPSTRRRRRAPVARGRAGPSQALEATSRAISSSNRAGRGSAPGASATTMSTPRRSCAQRPIAARHSSVIATSK